MAVQTAVKLEEAPRSMEGLMELGTFVLKKLGTDLGLKDNGEQWASFVGLPKDRMCEALLLKLKAHDAASGGAPKTAPVVEKKNEDVPFDGGTQMASGPAVEVTPTTTKTKKEPRHNGKTASASDPGTPASEAPNTGTGRLVTEGPTGGDFMILLSAVKELTRANEQLNKNVATIVTNSVSGAIVKELSEQVTALTKTVTTLVAAQTGIAKVVAGLAEANGLEIDGIFEDVSEASVKAILSGGKA
jgi:hypothetical protein